MRAGVVIYLDTETRSPVNIKAGLGRYAEQVQDVEVMHACVAKVPRWNYPGSHWPNTPGQEYLHRLHLWQINARGMGADRVFAQAAVSLDSSNRD